MPKVSAFGTKLAFFNFTRCFCCCVVFVVDAVAVIFCDTAKFLICVNLISNVNPYWQGI